MSKLSDVLTGIGAGIGSLGIGQWIMSLYRNKQQVSKDSSSARSSDLSVGEQALRLVNEQMEKIARLTQRIDDLEEKNRTLKKQVEMLTEENTFLKAQIEVYARGAKRSIPKRANFNKSNN